MEAADGMTPKEEKKEHGIPGSTLKIIAIVAMLIDHIAAVCLDSYISTVIPLEAYYDSNYALKFLAQYGAIYYGDMAMRLIGRFGFPIFVFLLIEGFMHTSNIKKYIRNLAIFALISEIPFNLAMNATLFSFDNQSVFVTLLIGLITIYAIDEINKLELPDKLPIPVEHFETGCVFGILLGYLAYDSEIEAMISLAGIYLDLQVYMILGGLLGCVIKPIVSKAWTKQQEIKFVISVFVTAAGMLLANFLNTDYAGWGVFTIVVMYYFRNASYKKRMGMGALTLTIMQGIEATSFLMMIPANMYNGKRGLNLKYFFYAFYPVHLLILYLITFALGYTGFAIR